MSLVLSPIGISLISLSSPGYIGTPPKPPIPTGLAVSPNLTIHGNASQLIPQSGARMTFNQYGLSIVYQDYQIDKRLAISMAPGVWSPHPIWGELQNSIGEMSIEFGDVFATIHCVYRGFFFSITSPIPISELLDSTTSQPIDTHPNFVTSIGGTSASPLNNAKYDPTTGKFIGFPSDPLPGQTVRNPLGGVTSYLAASVTWRVTQLETSPITDISQVGHIVTEPLGVSPPALPPPQNWLLKNITQQQQGNCYQTSYEYGASDPGAEWSPLIYTVDGE